MHQKMKNMIFDVICGVPYTALPIATVISVQKEIPMLLLRKERKDYGTKKRLEGLWDAGDKAVVLEDIVTSGSSCIEAAKQLEEEQLEVQDIIVFIDRGQGGSQAVLSAGYRLHAVYGLQEIVEILLRHNIITKENGWRALDFIQKNPVGV
jgi:uridine monophosphate synthetase